MQATGNADPTGRDLYLDLLTEVLLNTIDEGAAINPQLRPLAVEPFNPEMRAQFGITAQLQEIDRTGVWWRKEEQVAARGDPTSQIHHPLPGTP